MTYWRAIMDATKDQLPDEILIWEPPVLQKPEFRLYYDDTGAVTCYTCEKLEGNYIVIDAQTFAESRYDVKVRAGKIVANFSSAVVVKLTKNTEGTLCSVDDISIIVDEDDEVEKQYWKLKVYELE
jgi:hypothetical protein